MNTYLLNMLISKVEELEARVNELEKSENKSVITFNPLGFLVGHAPRATMSIADWNKFNMYCDEAGYIIIKSGFSSINNNTLKGYRVTLQKNNKLITLDYSPISSTWRIL